MRSDGQLSVLNVREAWSHDGRKFAFVRQVGDFSPFEIWKVEADGRVHVPSHWEVCDQYPAPGDSADSVELYVEKECHDW